MQLTNLASLQSILWNILERYNLPPEEAFIRARLDPSATFKAGKRYPIKKTVQLWKEAANMIPDPCFGLRVSECWHPSHLGILGYALMASSTLRSALQRLIRFHKVVSDIKFASLNEESEAGLLVLTLAERPEDLYLPQVEDATLTLVLSLLRMNYQKELTPRLVTLKHEAPECSHRYFEFFKSPVKFNARASSLALPLDVVDRRLLGGNRDIAEYNDELMTRYLRELGTKLTDRIKRLITDHLPSGDAKLETIASELGLSVRTLQRQLQDEGTSFVNLLQETRMELAKMYVKDRNMDLSEIAFLLGFAELSTFSRSFKRWTGHSPLQFRAKR